MKGKMITGCMIQRYIDKMSMNERSAATLEKYMRDIRKFQTYCDGRSVTKELVIAYKEILKKNYAVSSVNSMLVALNGFLEFCGMESCKVELPRRQRSLFLPEEKELTKEEYYRLIHTATANGKERLALILQTIGSTGIRISELSYITISALKTGRAQVELKGKVRTIFLPKELRRKLTRYAKAEGIQEGCIFVTRSGKPMNRSNVWKEMKALCKEARVDAEKVFPHNLRHLFAREFYAVEKDIAKLADVLGHSSIETTRIYILSTGREHEEQMERLRLIV